MSLSITAVSAVSAINSSLDSQDAAASPKTPAIKPTTSQEIQQLANSGQSASLIAESLGIPVSEVNSTLDITATTTETSSVATLATHINVQA
jgi:hypothetical protein